MKPSSKNITGVEAYDHTRFKEMPEYHRAMEALDDFVHAINRRLADDDERLLSEGQASWLKVVEQMAASLTYADCSGAKCGCREKLHFPVAVKLAHAGFIECGYYCPTHDYGWKCGYAVNIGEWL